MKGSKRNLAGYLKAIGQDMVDNPEKYIGEIDDVIDISIYINFTNLCIDRMPDVDVHKTFMPMTLLDTIRKEYEND